MPTLPNPFDTGPVHAEPVEAAALPKPSGEDGAAADLPMAELIARGFDCEAFVADCDPLPAFLIAPGQEYLKANDLIPVLQTLAGC
jgi:hypothetical protein